MFEDKLKERYEGNKKALEESFEIFRSMFGQDDTTLVQDSSRAAIETLLKYFDLDRSFVPDTLRTWEDVLAFIRAEKLFCHKAHLEGKWWDNAVGPILTKDGNGTLVVLLPSNAGYKRFVPETRKFVRANSRNTRDLDKDVLNFFNLLPRKKLSVKEYVRFATKALPKKNILLILLVCAAATLLNLLVPVANKIMFSEVIPSGDLGGILPICTLLLGSGISAMLFTLVRNFVLVRAKDKINATIQPALFSRLLSLPPSFFRTRSSSDLSARVLSANEVYRLFTSQVLSLLAGGIFSILYIFIAFAYAKQMIFVVTLSVFLFLGQDILMFFKFKATAENKLDNSVISDEFTFGALSGIHKIKNNKAEVRVFTQWLKRYCDAEEMTATTPRIVKSGNVLGTIAFTAGSLGAWIVAAKSHIPVSDYMAFMSAFGVMQASLGYITPLVHELAQTVPIVRLAEPILNAEPEISKGNVLVNTITGGIDINHVSFRYTEASKMILDDVSLKIQPGENIGLVGSSGCGKSTLMRIMLGFEKPSSGSVFYGQYNLDHVNMGSLRQYVGYCPQAMQVFPGSVADNIRLAKPNATDEEVWEAARVACIDEDIKNMPSGMDTLLGEGGSGLSGGQCQRLLIARAVINKPKVLFFDEATAALDNITQHIVVENLKAFGCTRISIAHRLSTIMDCDRILVLDKGKIVEEGAPKDLIEQKGFFYQLSKRQL